MSFSLGDRTGGRVLGVDMGAQNIPSMNNGASLVADDHATRSTASSVLERSLQDFENNGSSESHQNTVICGNEIRRKVYRFEADWMVASIAWSREISDSLVLAISSYIEDYRNFVQVVSLTKDSSDQSIKSIGIIDHPYPATKVLWTPQSSPTCSNVPRFLATSADYLRLWRVEPGTTESFSSPSGSGSGSSSNEMLSLKLECLLNSNAGSKNCSPLTSFDWNDVNPGLIVTASVDSTCCVWDLNVGKLLIQTPISANSGSGLYGTPEHKTSIGASLRGQILAHNHEVFDVSFSRAGSGDDIFATVGGDSTIRLFDLRQPTKSSIVYELPRREAHESRALVRVSCNKKDANFLSAFAINSNEALVLDLRNPGTLAAKLTKHNASLNSMSWAPHSAHHICTASDDNQALIWELSKLPSPVEEPLLFYKADGKVNVIDWSASHPDWIAIGFENYLELLRV